MKILDSDQFKSVEKSSDVQVVIAQGKQGMIDAVRALPDVPDFVKDKVRDDLGGDSMPAGTVDLDSMDIIPEAVREIMKMLPPEISENVTNWMALLKKGFEETWQAAPMSDCKTDVEILAMLQNDGVAFKSMAFGMYSAGFRNAIEKGLSK
jgi:hypothetical protein